MTVYRSLSAFTDLNILTTVDFKDGPTRYEYLSLNEVGHHHHIICEKCKKVTPVKFCIVEG